MAAVMARLNKIWDSRSVSFCTIFRLYKSWQVSPVSIMMYDKSFMSPSSCTTWQVFTSLHKSLMSHHAIWQKNLSGPHHTVGLLDMDTTRVMNPGVGNKVLQETPLDLIQQTQDEWHHVHCSHFPGQAHVPLLATINWQAAWFGHIIWHDTLLRTIFQGYIKGGQCRGKQRKAVWWTWRSGLAVHWGTFSRGC